MSETGFDKQSCFVESWILYSIFLETFCLSSPFLSEKHVMIENRYKEIYVYPRRFFSLN